MRTGAQVGAEAAPFRPTRSRRRGGVELFPAKAARLGLVGYHHHPSPPLSTRRPRSRHQHSTGCAAKPQIPSPATKCSPPAETSRCLAKKGAGAGARARWMGTMARGALAPSLPRPRTMPLPYQAYHHHHHLRLLTLLACHTSRLPHPAVSLSWLTSLLLRLRSLPLPAARRHLRLARRQC